MIGTRVALSQFGLEKGYAQELVGFWVNSPLLGALQAILLLIVWIHGCLGVHFWLRLKPFYPRVKGLLLSIAVLLPALALLGYYQGGERDLGGGSGPCMAGAHDVSPSTWAPRLRTRSFWTSARGRSLSWRWRSPPRSPPGPSDNGESAGSARSG